MLTATESNINNMEHPVTVLRQRATTFNPEAAAFNPRFSSPTLFNAEPGSTTTAVIPRSAYPMAPIFNRKYFLNMLNAQ